MLTRNNVLSGMLASLISVSGFAETIYVTNTNNSGSGSLRDAIITANADPSPTNILFNIQGTTGNERIIGLSSALPAFTAKAEIKTDAAQTGKTVLLSSVPGQSSPALAFNTGSEGSTVDGLTFRQFVNGLTVNVPSVTIINNSFENNPGAGTEIVLNAAHGAVIRSNTFTGNANAIAVNGNLISILGNNFNGEKVAVGNSNALTFGSLEFPNTFSDIAGNALSLNQVHGSTVQHNTFLNVGGQGITVQDGNGNVIRKNTLPQVTGWEISLNGGHSNKITDNFIVGIGTFSGILVQNGLSNSVTRNHIREGSIQLSAVSGSAYGVVRVDSNYVVADPRNNPGHGAIQLSDLSNATVQSNFFQDNLGEVISLYNAANVIVKSNKLENNTGSGVYVQGGQSVKISRNTIYQNSAIVQPRLAITSNNLKAAPVITSVVRNGNNVVISGSGTLANDTVEIFSTDPVTASNPLRQPIKEFIVPVKATGSTWSVTVATSLDYFIATSTDQNGNTSAYSLAKGVNISGPTSVTRNTSFSYATGLYPNVTYQWWVNADATISSGQGTNNATITFGPSFSAGTVYVGFTHPTTGWTVYQLSVTANGTLREESVQAAPLNAVAYPNPFSTTAKVKLDVNEAESVTLNLYDSQGKQVSHSECYTKDGEAEIGRGVPAGTYLLHVITGKEKQVIRVTKSEQ